MNNDQFLKQCLDQELEHIGINQLHSLGNQAQQLGLIAGHGYHGGQYEILRQGQAIVLSPQEAATYLAELIASVNP
jgi:hypothetical protein